MSATSIMNGGGLESVHQLIDRRLDRLAHLLGQMRIDGGGGRGGMTENALDDAQVDARFQQVRGKGVTQRMYVGGLGHTALLEGATKGALQGAAGDGSDIVLHAVAPSGAWGRREQSSGRTKGASERVVLC